MPATTAPRALRAAALAATLAAALLPAAARAEGTSTGPAPAGIALPAPEIVDSQLAQARAAIPGSLMALQPFRNAQTTTQADGTQLTLTSLNPNANAWFVLEATTPGGRTDSWHLEVVEPAITALDLSQNTLTVTRDGLTRACTGWRDELAAARGTDLPFAPVCDWALYLRNPVAGNRSSKEAVADFLRDNFFFGDDLVNFIKGSFFEDAFMVSSETADASAEVDGVAALGHAALSSAPMMRPYMAFDLTGTDGGAMQAGAWYAVEDAPGIYASVTQPGLVANEIFATPGANRLDGVENRADVYLVAFDMSEFDIGYELGTDHPRVNWSPRPSGNGRHYQAQGPDGFGTVAPLVRVGVLNPSKTERVAATFTGGFKREHGAWRFGPYAGQNWGYHYGFAENGVVLSKLWPTLATLYVLDDGSMHMESWTEAHDELLPRIVYARQNGMAVVEGGLPGAQVPSWGGGNWSGSANADLRTLRGGACVREAGGRQFLIYAYFSSATPSGMARVFQSYGCEYAMLLDMNSQEHTYMALYTHEGKDVIAHHLVSSMSQVDGRGPQGQVYPRFISSPDNRDFFYLLRKE